DTQTPTDTTPSDTGGPADADTGGGDALDPGCKAYAGDVGALSISTDGRFRMIDGLAGAGIPARLVTVYLPAEYDANPTKRYPVLYMHDGQNLFFSARSAFGTEWGVDEAVDQLVSDGTIDPIIVVGVDNTAARIDEYTPTVDPGYGGGDAPAYGDYLRDVVKPAIDRLYRTQCEGSVTGLVGSSLGGLVSFYLGMRDPGTWGRVGAVSPSFWWNSQELSGEFEGYTGPLPTRLWVDMGTGEGSGGETIATTRRVVAAARAKGMVDRDDLGYLEVPGAQHNEAAWKGRMPAILAFLYGKTPRPALTSLIPSVVPQAVPIGGAGSALYVEVRDPKHGRLTPAFADMTFATTDDAFSVTTDGRVLADAAASATITVSWGGVSGTVDVTAGGGGATTVATTFEVTVPASTPEADTVYLAGSPDALGPWAPDAVAMTKTSATTWTATVSLPAGSFEWKVTRGGWETVETATSGADVPNTTSTAGGTITHTVQRWHDQ
ncbi:MAG: hypothetical protein KC635_20405, partial [Myxococcales bacterium]|nr:hypothetical protein [Myxococcales bacterium]